MKQPVTFDKFNGGIADYDYDGYNRMIGIYPFEPIGTAQTTMPAQFDIGGYSNSLYAQTPWSWQAGWGVTIKTISDGTYDGVVYTNRIELKGAGNSFFDTTPSGSIIDCIIYKGYFLYITSSGLRCQAKGNGTTPYVMDTYAYGSSSKMFLDITGQVYILDGSYVHFFKGYNETGYAFNPANASTFSSTFRALDASINLDTLISCASNNLYAVFGTQSGNVYTYSRSSGILSFTSVVHMSDLPVSILFECANKIYAITQNLELIMIQPSAISTYTILKNGVSTSRMPLFLGTPIAGYITDKFYVFWYNSGGQDNINSVGFYDSGILPSGVYAFTNPALVADVKDIGRFCLSGIDPSPDATGKLMSPTNWFNKSVLGWNAVSTTTATDPVTLGVGNNPSLSAIFCNRSGDQNMNVPVPKYLAQFDTAVISIGEPVSKEKMTHLNVTFLGNGCPIKISYRPDNNLSLWRNAYTQLHGADALGYIDLSTKGLFDQSVTMEDEVNIQFRIEFKPSTSVTNARGVKLDNLQIN